MELRWEFVQAGKRLREPLILAVVSIHFNFQNNQKIHRKMLTPKIKVKNGSISLTAKVECILCVRAINATMSSKKRGEERGKLSWNISNYERHIKRHFKIKKSEKNKSDRNLGLGNSGGTSTRFLKNQLNISDSDQDSENDNKKRGNSSNIVANVSDFEKFASGLPKRRKKTNVIDDFEDDYCRASSRDHSEGHSLKKCKENL